MTYRLVCSGYATPGQTSRELLDRFDIGMLLDFAYGFIVEKLGPEAREEFDKSLNDMDSIETEKMIEKQLSDGTVIKISEARLERIRRNAVGISQMNPRKGG